MTSDKTCQHMINLISFILPPKILSLMHCLLERQQLFFPFNVLTSSCFLFDMNTRCLEPLSLILLMLEEHSVKAVCSRHGHVSLKNSWQFLLVMVRFFSRIIAEAAKICRWGSRELKELMKGTQGPSPCCPSGLWCAAWSFHLNPYALPSWGKPTCSKASASSACFFSLSNVYKTGWQGKRR